MSSKSSKRSNASKSVGPIVTRTKAAQRKRNLRTNKDIKTVQPSFTAKVTKAEQSPKVYKNEKCCKDTLLKKPVKKCVEVIEQVEYHPNKLKRNISTKKIILNPKYNYKIIASTNKRKLVTPQKGIKSPPPKRTTPDNQIKSPKRLKHSHSPDLSVQELIRLTEDTNSLSEEDFLEILTCPSPVWWEDPPDGRYFEDAIDRRTPDIKPLDESNIDSNIRTMQNTTDLKTTNNDKNFSKKQQKLENILGNIKNKTVNVHIEPPKVIENTRNRKASESTEGDISDLSFNEEEMLKSLENMDIPIENQKQVKLEINDQVKKEVTESVEIKKEIDMVPCRMPPLKRKPDFYIKKEVIEQYNCDLDSISDSNIRFISDEDVNSGDINSNTDNSDDVVTIMDTCTNSSSGNDSVSFLDLKCSVKSHNNNEQIQKHCKDKRNSTAMVNENKNEMNDLTEYITVYKIIPDKCNNDSSENKTSKNSENSALTNTGKVRGQLNDFFKKCKNNKRPKKNNNEFQGKTLNSKKENSNTQTGNVDNRLKRCAYCVLKTEKGIIDVSCQKCEKAAIFSCDTCNFFADTKEVYRKHVSNCKDVERITWNHSYVLNQT